MSQLTGIPVISTLLTLPAPVPFQLHTAFYTFVNVTPAASASFTRSGKSAV